MIPEEDGAKATSKSPIDPVAPPVAKKNSTTRHKIAKQIDSSPIATNSALRSQQVCLYLQRTLTFLSSFLSFLAHHPVQTVQSHLNEPGS